jgi:hypothetical protein
MGDLMLDDIGLSHVSGLRQVERTLLRRPPVA